MVAIRQAWAARKALTAETSEYGVKPDGFKTSQHQAPGEGWRKRFRFGRRDRPQSATGGFWRV